MSLHERIAAVLGWSLEDVQSVSLQSLRDLVRPVDPELVAEISAAIQSGRYIMGTATQRLLARLSRHAQDDAPNMGERLQPNDEPELDLGGLDEQCPGCRGDGVPLGTMGRLEWLRCRHCGKEWSRSVAERTAQVRDMGWATDDGGQPASQSPDMSIAPRDAKPPDPQDGHPWTRPTGRSSYASDGCALCGFGVESHAEWGPGHPWHQSNPDRFNVNERGERTAQVADIDNDPELAEMHRNAAQRIKSDYGQPPIEVSDSCPTAAIRYKLGNMHVGTSDEEVEQVMRDAVAKNRAKAGKGRGPSWTPEMEEEAVRYALWQHAENRAEYRSVMGGGWGVSGTGIRRSAYEATPVPTPEGLDDFTRTYLEAAAWSSSHGENGERRIDDMMNDGEAEWAPETIEQAKRECAAFQQANADDIATYTGASPRWNGEEMAGYLFWLNRSGHGSGFWDHDGYFSDDALQRLDDASKAAGERDLVIGDDGKVYFYPSDESAAAVGDEPVEPVAARILAQMSEPPPADPGAPPEGMESHTPECCAWNDSHGRGGCICDPSHPDYVGPMGEGDGPFPDPARPGQSPSGVNDRDELREALGLA